MRSIFLSFHQADAAEVAWVQNQLSPYFAEVRTLGAQAFGTSLDHRINSDDSDYVMRQIREKYISGTTCTIVLIGECTWARKYVDWEIAATMRNNPTDPRGGIFAMQLPSAAASNVQALPVRLRTNVLRDESQKDYGYARFLAPQSAASVQREVELAITRAQTIEPVPGSLIGLQKINNPC